MIIDNDNDQDDLLKIICFISLIFLFIFIFIITPLRYLIFQRKMIELQIERKDITVWNMITFAAGNYVYFSFFEMQKDETIFEYLSSLNQDNIKFSMDTRESQFASVFRTPIDIQQPDFQINKQLRQRAKNQNTQFTQCLRIQRFFISSYYNQQGTIICNFYECFCEGCPWQISEDNFLLRKIQKMKKVWNDWFFRNQKYVAFFLIYFGAYLWLPIYYGFLAFVKNQYVIYVFSIIFFSLQFFTLTFTLSFIITRRFIFLISEMVRLEKHNQIQRALIVHYHLRRAIVFSVLFIVLSCIMIVVINNTKQEYINPHSQSYFYVLSAYYYFLMNINLLILLKYSGCLRNDLISDDDRILKAQQRLYALQNNLIKYFPSNEVLIQEITNLLKQSEELNQEEQQLQNQVKIEKEFKVQFDILTQMAKKQLSQHMKVVENQKFKKIKKNLGTQRFLISLLTLYLYFQCVALTLLGLIIIILSKDSQEKDDCNYIFNTIIIELLRSFQNQKVFQFCVIYLDITITLQFTLVPYLTGIMCNKQYLIGRDYGQKLNENTQEKIMIELIPDQSQIIK